MPLKRGKERPAFVQPMAARLVQQLPESKAWLYELKFDGYRALVIKDGDSVTIRSRNDRDLTSTYPSIGHAALAIAAEAAVIDGEIVAVDASGRPSFQALQHRSAFRGHTILFYAFDLLYLDGTALMSVPLSERRRQLQQVVAPSDLRYSEELPELSADVIDAVRGLGLEGIIAKRRDSRYIPGQRTDAWQKLKLDRQQEFVIGGYRPGSHGVDALLVGFYQHSQLRFAGKVRAGFTPHVRREVVAQLEPLRVGQCPFVDLPNSRTSHWGGGVTAEQMHDMQWVAPKLVAQIRFVEWTADDHLRHASFVGMRTDKQPRAVRRE